MGRKWQEYVLHTDYTCSVLLVQRLPLQIVSISTSRCPSLRERSLEHNTGNASVSELGRRELQSSL